ncbi:MAG: hypothetical protein WC663_02490 [Patescibacteria group bacterium]
MSDSATGVTCVTEKVVDVTEDCPKAGAESRSIFIYTREKRRGRIVKMVCPCKDEKQMGACLHFFIDELSRQMNVDSRHDTFGSWATRLGLDKTQLLNLIVMHAPSA